MDITELETLAAEKNASFKMRPDGESFVVKAKPDVVKEILAVIDRDEVLAVLRARDGFTDEIEHIVAPKVKSLAQYLEEYRLWFAARSTYYRPTEEQLAKMWSALEEGDRVYFDYALTITVRRIRDGKLVAIDRRGRETRSLRTRPRCNSRGSRPMGKQSRKRQHTRESVGGGGKSIETHEAAALLMGKKHLTVMASSRVKTHRDIVDMIVGKMPCLVYVAVPHYTFCPDEKPRWTRVVCAEAAPSELGAPTVVTVFIPDNGHSRQLLAGLMLILGTREIVSLATSPEPWIILLGSTDNVLLVVGGPDDVEQQLQLDYVTICKGLAAVAEGRAIQPLLN